MTKPAVLTETRQANGSKRVMHMTLSVDARGHTLGCKVKTSSGDSRVDDLVCSAFARRSRWVPALDEYGEPVPGEVDTGIIY